MSEQELEDEIAALHHTLNELIECVNSNVRKNLQVENRLRHIELYLERQFPDFKARREEDIKMRWGDEPEEC
jgi:hypothetical protein